MKGGGSISKGNNKDEGQAFQEEKKIGKEGAKQLWKVKAKESSALQVYVRKKQKVRLERQGRQSHIGEDTPDARLRDVDDEEPEKGLEEMSGSLSGRLLWQQQAKNVDRNCTQSTKNLALKGKQIGN